MASVWRSPLLWFLVLGGALFAADAARRAAAPPDRTIVVDDALREALHQSFVLRERREPTAVELEGTVGAWVREEVLVREALATGLHRADPVVRRRLVQAMEFLLEDAAPQEPPESELRAWFEAHRDAFAVPGSMGFIHVFTAGRGPEAEQRSAEIRARLDEGTPAVSLGDAFPDGPRIGPVTRSQLAASFGDRFVTGLDACAPRSWCGPVASELGWHVVRIDERRDERVPSFEDVAHTVRDAWRVEATIRHRDEAIERLIDSYELSP